MKYNPPFGKCGSVIVLALVMVYLLFSVGVLKATHFCMGLETSVDYFTAESEECACSLFSLKSDQCCDNVHTLLKLDDSQKSFSTYKLSAPVLSLLAVLYTLSPVSEGSTSALVPLHPADSELPPRTLFRLYCSFVLYDSKLFA